MYLITDIYSMLYSTSCHFCICIKCIVVHYLALITKIKPIKCSQYFFKFLFIQSKCILTLFVYSTIRTFQGMWLQKNALHNKF